MALTKGDMEKDRKLSDIENGAPQQQEPPPQRTIDDLSEAEQLAHYKELSNVLLEQVQGIISQQFHSIAQQRIAEKAGAPTQAN